MKKLLAAATAVTVAVTSAGAANALTVTPYYNQQLGADFCSVTLQPDELDELAAYRTATDAMLYDLDRAGALKAYNDHVALIESQRNADGTWDWDNYASNEMYYSQEEPFGLLENVPANVRNYANENGAMLNQLWAKCRHGETATASFSDATTVQGEIHNVAGIATSWGGKSFLKTIFEPILSVFAVIGWFATGDGSRPAGSSLSSIF